MKNIVLGILAHVDSGKTTLSESMLYTAGIIRKMGRVDHKDSFLDTNHIERERGITIFSKQAVMSLGDTRITLLDTPGHVDFSAETERTMNVIDYAVLVINAGDGVQSHTETLWKMLEHYNVPVFIFVNKMDLEGADRENILSGIKRVFGERCIDFTKEKNDIAEEIALSDSKLLDEYLESGDISDQNISENIFMRRIFPCYFGSALNNEGVGALLDGIDRYSYNGGYGNSFSARVFKITDDEKGKRLTYLKITGGVLKVKDTIYIDKRDQKVNEIRIYSGRKYETVKEAESGSICAVPGLTGTFAGQGLGNEKDSAKLISEPVLTYSVRLPETCDPVSALRSLRKLEEEDPQMKVLWNEDPKKINVQVMGEIQLEVLRRVMSERFGIDAEFESGSIIYRETIKNKVEGAGHFEPLRHYAEVHLMIEPLKRGSGLIFDSDVSEDVLERNWQRLIMTHLTERVHKGVLTGSPVTDMKITLINGRAHVKHTEGGDFRQAVYRAVRQGLMQAESILLEPWYSFRIEVPQENTGRLLTDIQNMGAVTEPVQTDGAYAALSGRAPVSRIRDYLREVTAYTHGKGRVSFTPAGYYECVDAEEVIKEKGYDPESDIENTADSVFCSHGSSQTVKWDKVQEFMHIPFLTVKKEEHACAAYIPASCSDVSDEELLRIFEMTYGRIKEKRISDNVQRCRIQKSRETYPKRRAADEPEEKYLLVDGYNIIFACDELKNISEENLDLARAVLVNRLANYRAVGDENVIVVFDAYKVEGKQREREEINGITVVYTKEAETADEYIEKATGSMCSKYRVRVATSDNLERLIILGHGALRISAADFLKELEDVEEKIRRLIEI